MKKNLPVTGREKTFSANVNILSTTDAKGTITDVNDDFVDISGFSADELLRQNHNIVRHPDMPPAAFQNLWDTIKGGQSWMGLVKNRCKNGDHYWVSAYVTPIHHNGRITEYQSVRTRPPRECVERADRLYAQVMAGQTLWVLRWPMPGLRMRLLGAVGLAGMLGWLGGILMGAPAIQTLVPVLLFVALAAGWAGWVTRPLARLQAQARSVVRNPLCQYVYTGRVDEVGEIQFAMRMLATETGAAVGRVAEAARRLSRQIKDMVGVIEQTRQEILREQAETDQVATAVNEMAASVQEVARNAQHTARSAEEADTSADSGRRVVVSTGEAIGHLSDEVERATQAIHELEQRTEEISTVVEVIQGIAEQTNLLALNAAIEAARAGEEGRGFAVVADEVRSLAARTQNATQEIQSMIERLQAGAQSSVQVMGQSQEQAGRSVRQADEAAQSLEEIARSVSSITEMSVQIATAVDEQSAVSEEINRSITNIRHSADGNAEAIVNIEQAAEELTQLSEHLEVLAGQFWDRIH
ncbi:MULTISPECIES: PAS domain-containing methyl-accepting chemotaxis protein [unclassified Ectothiorhodospira]|uniref:methyl-accepting chemotaxis protein n=1 Tax=unclassified Ectothiorhodospira TaxID=2684909 RepID=UPI001EE93EBC|nr:MULTISPECIES: PAS domain-containing methyl-accepting chemotaxis protein [unclassified Ectothiorhodospira]MCG5514586.1 methyl-accepting chemotaxis protein [Ectothiorhodospira sp. 9100]MCG5518040.1 methyl-accepting chemotaxis protein [Ectothiorhodospira sp. 9905]